MPAHLCPARQIFAIIAARYKWRYTNLKSPALIYKGRVRPFLWVIQRSNKNVKRRKFIKSTMSGDVIDLTTFDIKTLIIWI